MLLIKNVFFSSKMVYKLGYLKIIEKDFPPLKSSPQSAGLNIRIAYNYILPKHKLLENRFSNYYSKKLLRNNYTTVWAIVTYLYRLLIDWSD